MEPHVTDSGATVWGKLEASSGEEEQQDDDDPIYGAKAITALLRVMMLRDAPPAELIERLSPAHARVVQEGARLRARLPTYLAQRRALLVAHCPLIAPLPEELQTLILRFEGLATTDELWATGLVAARQRAAHPRAEDVLVAAPLRRSARLRQKRE
jgi:hypothetical protein